MHLRTTLLLSPLLIMTAANLGCGGDPPSGTGGEAPTSCAPFADEQRSPTAIAVDATDVFWTVLGPNPGEGAVLKASKSCGPTTTLASGQPSPIAVAIDTTHVYWLDDKALSRVSKAGGAPEVLATLEGQPLGGGIALDDARVYYATYGAVLAVDKSGGAPTTLVTGACAATSVAVDDTHVYFSNSGCNGDLVRIPKAGGPEEIVMASAYSTDVAVDATSVYWVQKDVGAASRPKSGGEGHLLSSDAISESSLATDGTRVYFSDKESLNSVEKSGAGAGRVGGAGLKIATDGASVFWTSATAIHKAARPADTGMGAPPTGAGSLQLSWTIDRGKHCEPGSMMMLVLSGPTGIVSSFPCAEYAHTVTGLAPGSYQITVENVHDGAAYGVKETITVGSGSAAVYGPFDLGKCDFGGCGTLAVGCVADGVCDDKDDCVCSDCASDAYCNPGAQACPNDGVCEPHYEGCSCADCGKNASCP